MATGLLIRDFFKEYRELRYSNSGSIEFSEIELNAYCLRLTIEITHTDAPRYGSLKTLPENTHYGYCTLFRGSTVTDSIPIKFPKFRAVDIINQGIWNYHQLTENQQLGASTIQLSVNAASRSLWEVLGDGVGNLAEFLIGLYYQSEGTETPGWVLRAFDEEEPIEEPFGNEFEQYRAYPIASPFPDVAKFKSDIPCSFLFRLETWYLVNPLVYVVDNPTDTGDETEGEDEYPEPEQGDGNGDGDEFPTPSPPDPNRPIEDYTGGVPVPFDGKGQCSTAYTVTGVARVFDLFGEGVDYEGFFTASVLGPIRFVGRKTGIPGFGPTQSLLVVTGAQGDVLTTPNIGLDGGTGFEIADVEIVRQDGLPDNCYPNG